MHSLITLVRGRDPMPEGSAWGLGCSPIALARGQGPTTSLGKKVVRLWSMRDLCKGKSLPFMALKMADFLDSLSNASL